MARKYEIGIAADTGGFEKSIKNGLVDPLEEAEDALDSLEKAAKGTDLERGIDKAAKATKDLDSELDDARASLGKLKYAADDVGTGGQKGMRKLGDAGEEVSGELRQNLGETFSSFRGDLEDLPQIAQDVFGGLAGSVGGMLPAFGLAAGAAGIGLLINAFTQAQEKQEELTEAANEWADAYIEAGGRVLDFETTMARVRDITNERWSEAQENAKSWGVSVETAISAMAGSESALGEVTRAVDAQTEAAEKAGQAAQKAAEDHGSAAVALTVEEQAAQKARDSLNELTGAMDQGAARSDVYSRLLIDQARATEGATEKTTKFGDTVISLPDGHKVLIDAQTGRATQDANEIERRIQGISDKDVRIKVTTDGISAAQRAIDEMIRGYQRRSINIAVNAVKSVGWDR